MGSDFHNPTAKQFGYALLNAVTIGHAGNAIAIVKGTHDTLTRGGNLAENVKAHLPGERAAARDIQAESPKTDLGVGVAAAALATPAGVDAAVNGMGNLVERGIAASLSKGERFAEMKKMAMIRKEEKDILAGKASVEKQRYAFLQDGLKSQRRDVEDSAMAALGAGVVAGVKASGAENKAEAPLGQSASVEAGANNPNMRRNDPKIGGHSPAQASPEDAVPRQAAHKTKPPAP